MPMPYYAHIRILVFELSLSSPKNNKRYSYSTGYANNTNNNAPLTSISPMQCWLSSVSQCPPIEC